MSNHYHRKHTFSKEGAMRALIELSGELLKAILNIVLLGANPDKESDEKQNHNKAAD